MTQRSSRIEPTDKMRLPFSAHTGMAVALFVGLTALDTVSNDRGGGGSSNGDNRRDRDGDDEI